MHVCNEIRATDPDTHTNEGCPDAELPVISLRRVDPAGNDEILLSGKGTGQT